MSLTAVIFTLLSAICSPMRDIFVKKSREKRIFMWWLSVISLVLWLPLIWNDIGDLSVAKGDLYYLIGAALIHALFWFFVAQAYRHSEMSFVYPIIRTSPLLVLIFAVLFLGDVVTVWAAFGVLLVTISLYLQKFSHFNRHLHWRDLLRPEVLWALAALLSLTIMSLVDKWGVDTFPPLVYGYIVILGAMLFYSVPFFWIYSKEHILGIFKTEWKILIGSSIFATLNFPFLLLALANAQVSYVTGLKQSAVLFAGLFAVIFLKEKISKARMLSILGILVGCLLIVLN